MLRWVGLRYVVLCCAVLCSRPVQSSPFHSEARIATTWWSRARLGTWQAGRPLTDYMYVMTRRWMPASNPANVADIVKRKNNNLCTNLVGFFLFFPWLVLTYGRKIGPTTSVDVPWSKRPNGQTTCPLLVHITCSSVYVSFDYESCVSPKIVHIKKKPKKFPQKPLKILQNLKINA